jgi:tetratricopeptide (TPR) repeat protein
MAHRTRGARRHRALFHRVANVCVLRRMMAVLQLFAVMPFKIRAGPRGPFDFDRLHEEIGAAARKAGWSYRRADDVVAPGLITEQVFREIIAADLLVAEVSTENPNVFYELGIRHSLAGGGTLLLAQKGTDLPFDVAGHRALLYEPDAAGIADLGRRLELALRGYEHERPDFYENPLARALERQALAADPKADPAAFEADLYARLERATTREQLLGIWGWTRTRSNVPATPLVLLAQRLSELADWSTSAEILRAAVTSRPDDYEIHRQLGWYLRQLGSDHFEEATAEFQRALELNADDPEALGMLGGLLKRQRKYEEAASYYHRAAEVAPSSWNSFVNEAAVSVLASPHAPDVGLRRYQDLYDRLISEAAPADEWVEVMLGEATFALGDDLAAAEHYERVVALASSLNSVEAAATQLELFADAGFRQDAARGLAAQLRTRLEGSRAVSAGPAKRKAASAALPVIVHLSDLHFDARLESGVHRFDSDPSERPLSEHIVEDIQSGNWRFSTSQLHLVVSGDLAWKGLDSEFQRAEQCLQEIVTDLGIPRERVYLVPGNHDVNWSLAEADPARRFENYLRFIARFYGEDLARQRYPKVGLRLTDEPPTPGQILSVVRDDDARLVVACVNSCVYETPSHHYGYVGEKQLKLLRDSVVALGPTDGLLMVAVVHHHLHPFPEYLVPPGPEGEIWTDVSTIRDGGVVEQLLEKLGFSLVLHGHKHRAQSRETLLREVGPQKRPARPLIVCGAGSVSCLELEHSVPNQYQVIEMRQAPRRAGAEFVRLTWRTLDLAPGAEWVTTEAWEIPG